jgi:hypothetical protein
MVGTGVSVTIGESRFRLTTEAGLRSTRLRKTVGPNLPRQLGTGDRDLALKMESGSACR